MSKIFAEYSGLDLTKTNNEILAAWQSKDIFHRSIEEREGCPEICDSLKVHPLQMVTQVYTMFLLEQLKILLTVINDERFSSSS